MRCPSCDIENTDDAWNCGSCRINLYWASQHYAELAQLRTASGRRETVTSPPFLVNSHRDAMSDRAARGHNVDNKVRIAARKAMKRPTDQSGAGTA